MSDKYPQDTDAEKWPTGTWPGNYAPPSDGDEYVRPLGSAERVDSLRGQLHGWFAPHQAPGAMLGLLPPGAVILTREEAEQIKQAMCALVLYRPLTASQQYVFTEALALLSGVPE